MRRQTDRTIGPCRATRVEGELGGGISRAREAFEQLFVGQSRRDAVAKQAVKTSWCDCSRNPLHQANLVNRRCRLLFICTFGTKRIPRILQNIA